MKGNLKLRLLWGLAFLLVAPCAVAQKEIPPYGFAGEDFTVLNPSEEYIMIDLGIDEAYDNDDSYYEWRLTSHPEEYQAPSMGAIPPDINGGNVHKHRLRAYVSKMGTYKYELIRISKYGYQKDELIVTVRGTVAIVSISTEKECWEKNEDIDINDFSFQTDPPGFSRLVSLADDSKKALEDGQILHFLVRSNNAFGDYELSDKTWPIVVYGEWELSVGIEPEIEQFVEKLKQIMDIADEMDKKLDKDVPKALKKSLPIQPIKDVYVAPSYYKNCCNGRGTNHVSIEIGGKVGIKFESPPIFIIAPIVYAKIVGKISAQPNVTLDFVSKEAQKHGCDINGTISIPVHGEIGGEVGAGFDDLDFGVKGQVVGAVDGTIVLLSSSEENFKFSGWEFSLIIRAIVEYGIGSFQWEWVAAKSEKKKN